MVDLKDLTINASGPVDEAKAIFESEGVLAVKNLFPSEVIATVRNCLEQALDDVEVALRKHGLSRKDPDVAVRLTNLVNSSGSALSEAEKHLFLGHFPLDVRLAVALRAVPRHLNAHPLLFSLLSTKRLFVHMPPAARYVLPGYSAAGVPLHQDISYNRHMPEFCVVWVPLVSIDKDCGGMVAFTRSHYLPELIVDSREKPAEGWLPPVDPAAAQKSQRVVLAPLEPGDAVILDMRTLHASMANNSDRLRLSCDYRFFGERAGSSKHYLDIANDTIVPPTVQ